MTFAHDAARLLAPIAVRHALRVVPVADDRVLLVGDTFALALTADVDTVHVAYLERRAGAPVRLVGLDAYLHDARITAAERALFGAPVGRAAFVRAALRVVVAGLAARCADILAGERAWLERLRARDPQRWAGNVADAATVAAAWPLAGAR